MPIDYEDSYYDSEDFGEDEMEEHIFEVGDRYYKAKRYKEYDDFGQEVFGFDLYDESNNYIDSISVETIQELKEHIELYGL